MAYSSLFQGKYLDTDDTNPSRQLPHSVKDSKPVPAEEHRKILADPLKPDKTWSLTEPSLFSCVITTAVFCANGLGPLEQWLTETHV